MKATTLVAIATFAFVAACASAPKRVAQLDEARVKVEALSQDPLAQQAASRELAAARANLEQAEAALKKGEPETQVAHFAYLAGRNAEIGEARIDGGQITRCSEKGRSRAQSRLARGPDPRSRCSEATGRSGTSDGGAQERTGGEARDRHAEDSRCRGMVMTLGDVLFDTNAATLKPGAALTIDRLSKFLDQNADTRVIIEGHTDSQGPDAYNEELSRRRAQAVADDLVRRGVASSRLEVIGRGEGYPVADNSTSAGRQQNRRVEIVFSDEAGKFQQGASAETP